MEEGRTTRVADAADAEPTPPGDDGETPAVGAVASPVKKKMVRVRSRGEHAAGRSMSGGETNGGEANVSGKPPTREERELAYRLARERIFGTAADGDVGEGGYTTSVARDEGLVGRGGELSPSSSTSSLNKTNKAVRRNKIADMFDPDFKRAGRAPIAPVQQLEMMPQHPMMMPPHPGMAPQYPPPQYMVPPPQYMMPPPQYMVPPPHPAHVGPPPMGAQPYFVMPQSRGLPNELPPLPNGAPNVNQPLIYPQPQANGAAPFAPPPPRPPSH